MEWCVLWCCVRLGLYLCLGWCGVGVGVGVCVGVGVELGWGGLYCAVVSLCFVAFTEVWQTSKNISIHNWTTIATNGLIKNVNVVIEKYGIRTLRTKACQRG